MVEFLDFMQLLYEFMSYFGTATDGWADFTGDGWCGSADLLHLITTYTLPPPTGVAIDAIDAAR